MEKCLVENLTRNNQLVEPGSEFVLLTPHHLLAEAHSMDQCVLGAVRPPARKTWRRGKLACRWENIKGLGLEKRW